MSKQKDAVASKLQVATDKADVARLNNTLDNNWTAHQDTLAEMTDSLEIEARHKEWQLEQEETIADADLSDIARVAVETKAIDIGQISNNAVSGANGFMINADIKQIDNVWVQQEQDAISSGDEDKYIDAVENRLALGTMTSEEVAKGKREFGQRVYERQSLAGLHSNLKETVKNVNTSKMSALGAQNFYNTQREVENKVEAKAGQITDDTDKSFNRELKTGGLTLVDLETAFKEPVDVYAGETITPLTEASYDSFKASIVGQVSVDKGTSQYVTVFDTIADKMLEGKTKRADTDDVLRLMTKNKKARFTTQTNFDLLDKIQGAFKVGKRYDPEGWGNSFKQSELHGQGIKDVIGAYKEQVGFIDADDPELFIQFKSHITSLLDMYDDKGDKLTKQDYADWRAVEMRDVDDKNAQQGQRDLASGAKTLGEIVEDHNGRKAVFNATTKEFIRWQ